MTQLVKCAIIFLYSQSIPQKYPTKEHLQVSLSHMLGTGCNLAQEYLYKDEKMDWLSGAQLCSADQSRLVKRSLGRHQVEKAQPVWGRLRVHSVTPCGGGSSVGSRQIKQQKKRSRGQAENQLFRLSSEQFTCLPRPSLKGKLIPGEAHQQTRAANFPKSKLSFIWFIWYPCLKTMALPDTSKASEKESHHINK